jgi:hypothetical protein
MHAFRHPAVGEHVGEVEPAARLEQEEDFGEDGPLVRRQVGHAVRDHDVHGAVRDAGGAQVLDEAACRKPVR